MTTYLDRALQAARLARTLKADGDYNASTNRAYYAVFYAASGLLEMTGDERPGKTHASVASQVLGALRAPRQSPREVGRALTVAQNLRSQADYSLAGASEQDAADAIAAMERVLAFAQPLLEHGLQANDD